MKIKLEIVLVILCVLLGTAFPAITQNLIPAYGSGAENMKKSMKGNVSIYISAIDKTEEMPFEDYICSVVCAYCDYNAEFEALCALAVAFRSQAYCIYEGRSSDKADFSDKDLALVLYDEEVVKYGKEAADKKFSRIGEAVKKTEGQILLYEGKPAWAATHNSSYMNTLSAEEYCGIDIPYLKSVKSPESTNAVRSNITYTTFASVLGAFCNVGQFGGECSKWIRSIDYGEDNFVKTVNVCGVYIDGKEFAESLGLQSCKFEYSCLSKKIAFTVYGEGNGVGMSKSGANELALSGKSYIEILAYYYSGCDLAVSELVLD